MGAQVSNNSVLLQKKKRKNANNIFSCSLEINAYEQITKHKNELLNVYGIKANLRM